MTIGKNKKLGKKLKAGKKKAVDPFTRKEWYDIKAPSAFTTRIAGTTPVSRTAGTYVASDALKGRVFTVSLADLQVREPLFRARGAQLCLKVVPGPRRGGSRRCTDVWL